MTVYNEQTHVAPGDTWDDVLHNIMMDNIHALWANAVANGIPYFSAVDEIDAISLAEGQVLIGGPGGVPQAGTASGAAKELPVQAGIPPASGITAAGLELIESSGAGTAKPVFYQLTFDAGTDEGRMWIFQCQATPTTLKLKLKYRMASNNSSKDVVMVAQVAAISDTDSSVSAKVFDSANSSTIRVPDTANVQDEASITLTNKDSIASGDWVCIVLFRDANDAADNADGDLILIGLEVTYE
jgi:hypothetical protein